MQSKFTHTQNPCPFTIRYEYVLHNSVKCLKTTIPVVFLVTMVWLRDSPIYGQSDEEGIGLPYVVTHVYSDFRHNLHFRSILRE